MNSRKYPRTIEEAFGPYERGPVEPMREDYSNGWWWAMGIIAVFTVVIVVMTG